jgi:hypothetical protein
MKVDKVTEAGFIIKVERKFSVYTTFLDTVLTSEGVIREGETRTDAILRIAKELEQTAAILRKEADQFRGQIISDAKSASADPYPGMDNWRIEKDQKTTQVIDYKQNEQLEIAIDNATSLEQLDAIKAANPIFPAKMISHFNDRREKLTHKP